MGGAGADLKKDFKNIFKHSKRMIKGFFRGNNNECNCEGRRPGPRPRQWSNPRGFPPFCPFNFKSPLMILFYPKIIVGALILVALLFCGVSLYGLIVIILLILVFILI